MNYPRLIIAGTQSGVGKTTVSMGLMAAMSKRIKVQPFKVGPDYIDPAYHTFITGRKSRNLDGWMLDEDKVRYLFAKNASTAQLSVIEGVMGLFDGAEVRSVTGSTAHVAKTLKAPVILVIDGSGMSASGAAMVLGYKTLEDGVDLAGVIVNKVSGEVHYNLIKEAIETRTGVRVYGYLPKDNSVELPSRHLGLVPSVEIEGLKKKIERLAEHIEKTIEVENLIKLAENWEKKVPTADLIIEKAAGDTIPIAVAYDKAFNFYYWDNLDLLEELGAELRFFSPMKDKHLPENVAGIIFGGGFPEVFAAELEGNMSMKEEIKTALSNKMPYYAECGGLMYLLEELEDFQHREYKMVGYFPGKCQMTSRLQRFGYAHLAITEDCVFGKEGQTIKIHEFHRSHVIGNDLKTVYHLKKIRSNQILKEWDCGFTKDNGVAGYPHLHFYSNIEFAVNYLKACRKKVESCER